MSQLNTLVADPPPLRTDDDGVIRVGQTRVRLDTVVTAFNAGCGAEEILLKYPGLNLTDIYAVITYYLRRRAEVDVYLQERRVASEEARVETESRFPSQGVREQLLSRKPAAGTE